MNYKTLKRIIDIALSSSLLIILSPLFVVLSIMIKLESNGPLIYKQKRAGFKGKIFDIYKFRTMDKENDVNNFNEKDKVTKIGKSIRPLGIDELPQLLNILKGEMSFIGPRPYLTKYTDYYTEEQKVRLDARPGLFGPAACISEKISILKRIDIDVEYVKNISFRQDLKVLNKLVFNYIGIVSYRKQSSFGNKVNIKEDYQLLVDNFNETQRKKELKSEKNKINESQLYNNYKDYNCYEQEEPIFMLESIEENNNIGKKTLVKKLPHLPIYR